MDFLELLVDCKDSENQEMLFEMANIQKKLTNLPVNVWVDEKGAFRDTPHNLPRIKFQNNKSNKVVGEGISISISEDPKILIKDYETELNSYEIGQIKNFIKRNLNMLIKHWNQEIDTDELKQLIKKV